MRLEDYCSLEVGARLADAVAAAAHAPPPSGAPLAPSGSGRELACDGGAPAGPEAAGAQQGGRLPRLAAAKELAARLPGGWAFTIAARGAAAAAPTLVAPPGGASLLSKAAGGGEGGEAAAPAGVVSLVVGASGEILQAAALANAAAPGDGALAALAPRLGALVGLSYSWVAAGLGLPPAAELLGARGPGRAPAEAGVDVAARLAEPWAELLLHDALPGVRARLAAAALGGGGGRGGGGGAAAAAASAAVVRAVAAAPAGELPALAAALAEARGAAAVAAR